MVLGRLSVSRRIILVLAIGVATPVTNAAFWSAARPDVIVSACLTILAGFLILAPTRDTSRPAQGRAPRVTAPPITTVSTGIASPGPVDEMGPIARAMQIIQDRSVRAARNDADYRQAKSRLEAALSNISQGLCVHGSDGRLELHNAQFCSVLGLDPDHVKPGLSIQQIIEMSYATGNYPGRDVADLVAERQAFLAKREIGTFLIERANKRMISVVHSPMPDGGWVATYEDVTDRLAADAKINHMIRHDALTGLPNRLVLNERIQQALIDTGRNGQSALLFLNLDEFKRVNDTLGHSAGDSLLVAASERLMACVREGDTVARLGGDEFAIVQVGIARPEDAKLLAERVICTMQQPFLIEGQPVVVGVSIGLTLMPNDAHDSASLLKNADIALDRAKAEERGSFCFFEAEMDARLQSRRQLEVDLRAGLARDEFELFYQPLVNLTSRRVTGFEALIRWRHPKRGMVSPAEFIPVAEEIGLIVPLGEWVIRKACLAACSWPDDIKVAVNLSPSQFKSRNLVPTVIASLQESGLPARRLELEVTETLLLQDNETTLGMLHELRALGTRISMDDFGTGYSSLRYLRSFPFDKIKIDQSFIRDLSRHEDSIHIVRAVRGLCAGLGMTTTAEGVETEEQLDKICAEGCTEAQGFLFSPPRPAGEIPAILERVRLRDAASHHGEPVPVMPIRSGRAPAPEMVAAG